MNDIGVLFLRMPFFAFRLDDRTSDFPCFHVIQERQLREKLLIDCVPDRYTCYSNPNTILLLVPVFAAAPAVAVLCSGGCCLLMLCGINIRSQNKEGFSTG